MSMADTARQSYDAARQEMLIRMRLRDQALLVYLAIIGAMLGVSFGPKGSSDILLTIPFISLGVAILVSQHNILLAHLSQFCAEEIPKFLSTMASTDENAPNWDYGK